MARTRTKTHYEIAMHKNDTSGKKILVVDDDTATRDALALFLEGEGHNVAVAKNGKEALDYLQHNSPPDLILLDLTMPVLGTFEFRQNQMLAPSLASIPEIVLSAATDLPESADLLGDVGFVPKPLDGDVLLAAIHRFTVKQRPVVLVIEDESESQTLAPGLARLWLCCQTGSDWRRGRRNLPGTLRPNRLDTPGRANARDGWPNNIVGFPEDQPHR